MSTLDDTQTLATVRDLVRWGASRFREAGLQFGHGTDNALDEAYYIVLQVLNLPFDLPATYLEAAVTPTERTAVVKLLKARVTTRRPAPYLLGTAMFAGLEFEVDERVLVPRSPIGELIEREYQPWVTQAPERILDLCAGSGCIGIATAIAFPDAQVDLAELSTGALAVCRSNIKRHQLAGRVTARQSDVFSGLGDARYDLIVANPPYVPTAEWQGLQPEYMHEPKMALEAGGDGMDVVARILGEAVDRLNPGGTLICEVGGYVDEFEARWPSLPVTWIEFERGGDGVFVIQREALKEAT